MNELLNFIKQYWLEFLVSFVGIILGVVVIVLTKRLINHIKSKSSQERKTIHFPKVAMWVLFVIMATIVLVSFFVGDPKFSISAGIICVLGLMVFVIFSDSIEDFSIANFITLKKEVKTKTEEVGRLSSENTELRTQLTTIVSASIHNQNLNNVVLGFGDSFLKYARVEQVQEEDATNSPSTDAPPDAELNNSSNNEASERPSFGFLRSQFFRFTEPLLLNKYAAAKEVPLEQIQNHVRFANYLDTKDPIMEHRAIFDAYIKRPLEEVFIECTSLTANVNAYYRWYYMISLILQYAKTNKKSAKLVLLTPRLPLSIQSQFFNGALPRNLERDIERVKDNFQPAIQNGFLEIVEIDFTEEECQAILTTLQSKRSE